MIPASERLITNISIPPPQCQQHKGRFSPHSWWGTLYWFRMIRDSCRTKTVTPKMTKMNHSETPTSKRKTTNKTETKCWVPTASRRRRYLVGDLGQIRPLLTPKCDVVRFGRRAVLIPSMFILLDPI